MPDRAGVPLLPSDIGISPESRLGYALRYASRGFAVFPLHWIQNKACSCGDADCRSPGKHPLSAVVPHGVKDATNDIELLTVWFSTYPLANIGMAMGEASGGIWALDIDPRNGGRDTLEVLEKQHGKLPETAMALTGGGGQHHLFRLGGRKLPGKLGPGIDIKGDGGYIVVEPSMHVSGIAYVWEGSADPLEGMQIAACPAWIGTAAGASAAPEAAPLLGGSELLTPQRVLDLRRALVWIDADDRDNWIRVGLALKSTGDLQRAFAVWTEWSQVSEKYDPTAQRSTWAGLRPDGKLRVESIFAWAVEAGWVNPASAMAIQHAELDAAVAAANAPAPKIEIIAPPVERPDAFPIPELDTLGHWIDAQYPVTHPEITTQALLAIAAAATARVYISDERDPCHLYLGAVADSVDTGRYARDAVAAFMAEAGCRRMLRGTRLGSPSALFGALHRTPAMIHVTDEYGSMMQQAKRQPSGVLDQTLHILSSVYSQEVLPLDNPAEFGLKTPAAGEDQHCIYHPSLTLLALISTDQLSTLLRRSEIGRGALGQLLTVWADHSRISEHKVRPTPVPPWAVELWLRVRRLPAQAGDRSHQDLLGGNLGPRPSLVTVRMSDLADHDRAIDALSADPRVRSLLTGAKRSMRRIATALAPWVNPSHPVVNQQIGDWAGRYVVRHTRALLDRLTTLGSDEGKLSVMQQVLDLIEGAKTAGVSRRDITAQCWPFRALSKEKREELVGQLLADDAVAEVPSPGGRTKMLISRVYVKEGGK